MTHHVAKHGKNSALHAGTLGVHSGLEFRETSSATFAESLASVARLLRVTVAPLGLAALHELAHAGVLGHFHLSAEISNEASWLLGSSIKFLKEHVTVLTNPFTSSLVVILGAFGQALFEAFLKPLSPLPTIGAASSGVSEGVVLHDLFYRGVCSVV